MQRNYITVEGEIRTYEYTPYRRQDKKIKPHCPVCGERMKFLYHNLTRGLGQKKIGYICCNRIYLFKKMKVFKTTGDFDES